MPDKKDEIAERKSVVSRNISTEMRESYLDYAMSVITSRALPDVRDGLKPVHRRILFAMNQMGLTASAKFRKSATVVGEVLGNYHPHGDIAVYDTMVKMVQDFSMRYPLILGQGNWGCFTADTKVTLTDGRDLSFSELAEEHRLGIKNYTFTFNHDTESVEIAEIKSPRITRQKAELVEVSLDSGKKIRCTPDHRFMMRDGSYREAITLRSGDSLMPLYSRLSTAKDDKNASGYRMIFQPVENVWAWVHRLSDSFNIKIGKYSFRTGKVRHHIDFNKLNNNPENIVRMQWADHFKLHSDNIRAKHRDPKFEKAVSYFSGIDEMVEKAKVYNHKVFGVKILTEKEDVYDLTIDGTHNFALAAGVFVHNSIDADPAAAHRYTEAKMSRFSAELLRDIEKETVDFRPNYDNTKKEPTVLPAVAPNLLLNGTLGIAVGMATNIPPHNLGEVADAAVYLIENKNATTEDLLEFIKGPDFPTGGVVFGAKDLQHAYGTGRGGVVTRGEAEIVETKTGVFQIVITSIPYRVNKSELIVQIADLVREKKIEGIKGLRDESAKDIRVVVDLKQGSYPEKILNFLYKHTQLEESFHFNVVALVDGIPQTLSLKAILEEFVKHRVIVVRRRTEFDLKKALDREHILLGLKKALDHIDEIVKLIKKSKDAAEALANLMREFRFSDRQAAAILDMKLQRLAGLERKKVEEELAETQILIKNLKEILASPKKILRIITDELREIKAKYADLRRTKVVKQAVGAFSEEDLIPDTESVLVLTKGGYVKRTDPEEYRKQKRGGVGVVDLDTKEEDFVTNFLTASTHSDLLFFTDKGKAYQIKMYEIPEGKRATRGKSIMNFISLGAEEKVTSILAMPKKVKESSLSLLMVTKEGVGKKVKAESFHDVRRSGLIAIRLREGDHLMSAAFVEKGDECIAVTERGQSIRFKESDIREMGRGAAGVRVVRLGKGDFLLGADVIKKGENKGALLVIAENGYGKKTALKEYKTQKRGGSGIKTAKVTAKTGKLMASKVVGEAGDEEVIAISKKSQVIRLDIKEIPVIGRQTQGVRIMKLREGDAIASLTCL